LLHPVKLGLGIYLDIPNQFEPSGIVLARFSEGFIHEVDFFLGVGLSIMEPDTFLKPALKDFQ